MRSAKLGPMYPKNNRKRFMALLLLSSLFLTSGCWNQVEVINTIEAAPGGRTTGRAEQQPIWNPTAQTPQRILHWGHL